MTGAGRVCPNGHSAVLADQRFCETCGAAFALPAGAPPAPAAGSLPGGGPSAPAPGPRPPARRGPPIAVVVGLLLLVAGAAGGAAFVLIVKPFGGGPASPAPSSVAAATASATPGPTAPTPPPTPRPSPGPTEPPATPMPTSWVPLASPTGAPTASCRSEAAGITVTYPLGWFAYAGDARWTCLLFDRQPIDIPVDSELPPVAVVIYEDARPAATVAADFETTSVYTVLGMGSRTVDGRDAVAYEVENTGEGFYEKGVRQAVVIVDRGSRGSLILETTGTAGARHDANAEVLHQMVDALEID